MSKRELSVVLKVIDCLAMAACTFVALVVIPGGETASVLPVGSTILFVVGVVPLVLLAVQAWRLFSAIGAGEVFAACNARTLRFMAYLAAIDSIIWVSGLAIYTLCAPERRFAVVAALSVARVFAVSPTVVLAALSMFTANAAELKDDNDLVV